ncbi:probable serine/threonine-protein kinase ndrA [Helianthus annuus]|uniref:probable serine/threonine-protein kinase ndrA n=1 Tax=Helianthus annuus TaxID=4232 RepID=UPI0016530418|nr:probable serine/threonine-protein kinase ndrA [Helianthus annuus]
MVTDLRRCRLSELRRRALQRRAAEAKLSSKEEEQLLRNLEKKETEYMRLQRHKIGIDDFELLTLIGKGAFGEIFLETGGFVHQNQEGLSTRILKRIFLKNPVSFSKRS